MGGEGEGLGRERCEKEVRERETLREDKDTGELLGPSPCRLGRRV